MSDVSGGTAELDEHSTAKRDIVLVTAIGIAAYIAGFFMNLGAVVMRHLATNRAGRYDELPLAILLVVCGLAWFSVRRWKEYYREAQRRHAAQAQLISAHARLKELNETLERRIEERTRQLRQTQEELLRKERLATLGQLTATVSHELRNPLGVLRNTMFTVADAVREAGLPLDRPLARIDRSITRCNNIITELLDYTRITDLKPRAERIDQWLGELLAEYQLPEGLLIERDFDEGGDHVVSFDSDRLRRVVINLLDNAVQAMTGSKFPTGPASGFIRIGLRSDGGRMHMTIADSGPGIPPETLPRIFEPLFSTKGFGVGLGLPTVRQILEQHGGGIEIASPAGGGALVSLWLPLTAATTGEAGERIAA